MNFDRKYIFDFYNLIKKENKEFVFVFYLKILKNYHLFIKSLRYKI